MCGKSALQKHAEALAAQGRKDKRKAAVRNRDKPRDLLMEIIDGRITHAKIPREDVATYCGVSKATINTWMQMRSTDLEPAKAMKLCEAVGISDDEYRRFVNLEIEVWK